MEKMKKITVELPEKTYNAILELWHEGWTPDENDYLYKYEEYLGEGEMGWERFVRMAVLEYCIRQFPRNRFKEERQQLFNEGYYDEESVLSQEEFEKLASHPDSGWVKTDENGGWIKR